MKIAKLIEALRFLESRGLQDVTRVSINNDSVELGNTKRNDCDMYPPIMDCPTLEKDAEPLWRLFVPFKESAMARTSFSEERRWAPHLTVDKAMQVNQ